ncbi:hypothetical protein JX265_012866 [Neoarthrinium moseri]|uniref:Nuclear pore protein n=1 Tax=Neoarthrinium moseri TaxID=1658444 RepID=A0A9P9W9Y8_9PEZI|nr:uncharacterized protein JN550_009750 [Neoarthrinium moseri]KAI1852977.1 hypothetical protein JX265_012866 [Neoarthrinium moseri]KAI1863224.1 hypothetical protein JN550_009750 [Neoarthrinium moseri]
MSSSETGDMPLEPLTADATIAAQTQPLSPIEEQDDNIHQDQEISHSDDDLAVFHADTDAAIKVESGEDLVEFKVIISNVTSASQVLNDLFYGDASEKLPNGTRVITLDDEPESLAILMNIMHFRFARVPKRPTVDQLYELTRLTSKYKCTHLVEPWAVAWTEQLSGFAHDKKATEDNYKAAWISWELGYEKLLREMTDSLVLNCKVDEHGDVIHPNGTKLRDLVLPPGFLDRIIEIRFNTLASILEQIQIPMDHLSHMKRLEKPGFCKRAEDDVAWCEAMLLGSSMPKLMQAGLFPVPPATSYRQSLQTLKSAVYDIEYKHWEGRKWAPHKSHTGCNLGLRDSIKSVLDQMANPVQQSHLGHLFKQAQITGVDGGGAGCLTRVPVSPAGGEGQSALLCAEAASTSIKTEIVHDDGLKDDEKTVSDAVDSVAAPKGDDEQSDTKSEMCGEHA